MDILGTESETFERCTAVVCDNDVATDTTSFAAVSYKDSNSRADVPHSSGPSMHPQSAGTTFRLFGDITLI